MPYYIYVIELDPCVLSKRRFREVNPDYIDGKPCAYVGYSAKKPKDRFAQHKAGKRSSRWVREYGLRLRPRQYKAHNPMKTKDEAMAMEVEKARRLRKRGWGIWQN